MKKKDFETDATRFRCYYEGVLISGQHIEEIEDENDIDKINRKLKIIQKFLISNLGEQGYLNSACLIHQGFFADIAEAAHLDYEKYIPGLEVSYNEKYAKNERCVNKKVMQISISKNKEKKRMSIEFLMHCEHIAWVKKSYAAFPPKDGIRNHGFRSCVTKIQMALKDWKTDWVKVQNEVLIENENQPYAHIAPSIVVKNVMTDFYSLEQFPSSKEILNMAKRIQVENMRYKNQPKLNLKIANPCSLMVNGSSYYGNHSGTIIDYKFKYSEKWAANQIQNQLFRLKKALIEKDRKCWKNVKTSVRILDFMTKLSTGSKPGFTYNIAVIFDMFLKFNERKGKSRLAYENCNIRELDTQIENHEKKVKIGDPFFKRKDNKMLRCSKAENYIIFNLKGDYRVKWQRYNNENSSTYFSTLTRIELKKEDLLTDWLSTIDCNEKSEEEMKEFYKQIAPSLNFQHYVVKDNERWLVVEKINKIANSPNGKL